jgi:hypothetical protein
MINHMQYDKRWSSLEIGHMMKLWSNAKSLKMTLMPSLTLAKNVNEEEQLGELTLNFIYKTKMKGVAKQP